MAESLGDEELKFRLKFYGIADLSTGFHADEAVNILRAFDPTRASWTMDDLIELDNARQFAEAGAFPSALEESERKELMAIIPGVYRVIGVYAKTLTDETISGALADLDFTYHNDALNLLLRVKVEKNVSVDVLFTALRGAGVPLYEFLSNARAVTLFDSQLRDAMVSDAHTAELLIRALLDQGQRVKQSLPKSLTDLDQRELLLAYIKLDDANINTLRLIVGAKRGRASVIDKRLKVKARRRVDALTKELFKGNPGIKMGCSVSLATDQAEPALETLDGLVANYSYSRAWLEEDLTFPTILNNFLHLFSFADLKATLKLPAYWADLGVFERHLQSWGKDDYRTGAAFTLKSQSSVLQTMMYDRLLQLQDVELESVLKWFFGSYLVTEFGVPAITFTPSSRAAPSLERSRHLFSEMESVIGQFTLFVEDGEIDMDLLAMASEQVDYSKIPSLVEEKYAYLVEGSALAGILNLLFSDQVGLGYINDVLRGDNLTLLISSKVVSYDDFLAYQKPSIDYLLQQKILARRNEQVTFGSAERVSLLSELFKTGAISYGNARPSQHLEIDDMVTTGWLAFESRLLTRSEADYFDYMLNQKKFGNGPDLRNKYLHGSIENPDDENAHFQTYITVVELLIAVVIKMNDDYCLRCTATDGESDLS